eukprot:UN05137
MHYEYRIKENFKERSHLFSSKYDMYNAEDRAWYEWVPERDMVERFDIEACPSLVYFPRKCNGHTTWCQEELDDGGWIAGCDDFVEQCSDWKIWNGQGDWVEWLKELLAKEEPTELNERFKDWRAQSRT